MSWHDLMLGTQVSQANAEQEARMFAEDDNERLLHSLNTVERPWTLPPRPTSYLQQKAQEAA